MICCLCVRDAHCFVRGLGRRGHRELPCVPRNGAFTRVTHPRLRDRSLTGRLKTATALLVKLIRLLPPALALVVVGTWFGLQRLAMTATESENLMLRKHIAAASYAAPGTATASAKAAAPDRLAKNKGPLDWKTIAGQLVEMQRSGGIGDMRAITRLQQRMQAMTSLEIVAALDEIATLELSAADRALLERVSARYRHRSRQ